MDQIAVKAVIFKDEGGLWVASCVDYDIVATAKTPEAVMKSLIRTVASNVCVNMELGKRGLENIPPAPERIRSLYEAGKLSIRVEEPLPSNNFVRLDDARLVEAYAA